MAGTLNYSSGKLRNECGKIRKLVNFSIKVFPNERTKASQEFRSYFPLQRDKFIMKINFLFLSIVSHKIKTDRNVPNKNCSW